MDAPREVPFHDSANRPNLLLGGDREMVLVFAILAAMLLPALSKAKAKAQGIICLSNMRQLSLAWIQYAHDSNDRIPYASASSAQAAPLRSALISET